MTLSWEVIDLPTVFFLLSSTGKARKVMKTLLPGAKRLISSPFKYALNVSFLPSRGSGEMIVCRQVLAAVLVLSVFDIKREAEPDLNSSKLIPS